MSEWNWPFITTVVQVVWAVLLMAAILMQQRGTGLGGAFGGTGSVYRSKRGLERTLFRSTIVLAGLFVLTAILNILVR
ncbi:MAG: preprotein translocase subunit SecG [Patescibacteria group bacterium]|jgi:preprotein translocase subunit SecG